ncbi:MAG: hypothetical protein KAJ24_02970, partial [Candidatus Aenigmarchaeota archaeon]|nr:hypothetical protein [Candidatus Aenigmarchaeota archaeon]
MSILAHGVFGTKKHENKEKTNRFIMMFILGIIALQATWPIFMPIISIEDIGIEKGILYGDEKDYRLVRESIVRVKPPLFPFSNSRDYVIAFDLREVIDNGNNRNLKITQCDDERIHIELGKVTGWSFDELTTKINYQSHVDFKLPIDGANISYLFEVFESSRRAERFPYYYSHDFSIENDRNAFPVDVRNLTFSIERNTNAWNSLKKWT